MMRIRKRVKPDTVNGCVHNVGLHKYEAIRYVQISQTCQV